VLLLLLDPLLLPVPPALPSLLPLLLLLPVLPLPLSLLLCCRAGGVCDSLAAMNCS
jgi:hypothetical protein